MSLEIDLQRVLPVLKQHASPVAYGRVGRISGLLIEATTPGVSVGDLVEIDRDGDRVLAEVVGFRDDRGLMMPFSEVRGVTPGAIVRPATSASSFPMANALLGRLVDPFGLPVDGGPPIEPAILWPLDRKAPPVELRARISERFETSVRAIDVLLACGRGQRVGLFAGAGVGKTVLIRQIATMSQADVTVIGLIGERGSEARDILDGGLGERTVGVVATSDRTPMERCRGARAATAVAEFFRDQGKNVLLILDSLTRYAMALREIGLAAGEPPATKGYPPSVFAALPQLLERAAPIRGGGSITAFYTVLVEGDDLADPIADSARSLLDGHIVLSRDLAARGHFPAIDVLASVSRVARQVMTADAQSLEQRARTVLSVKREVDELRSLGAYTAGTNPIYDDAVSTGSKIMEWSRQTPLEEANYNQSVTQLASILNQGRAPMRRM